MPPGHSSVTISRRGAARVKAGHPWVYRSDVSADGIPPGAIVSVKDDHGRPLGTALYSSSSQIAIRMLSPEPVSDFLQLLRERIRAAIAYRELVVRDTDAYRVIFSEADLLPGLIVDRYADLLSMQLLTQAMDSDAARQTIVDELTAALNPAAISERVEPHIRELEQLPPRESGLISGMKASTIYTLNGVRFHYDISAGQKTGAFLDQRENYAAAAQYARGEALDVFCYQGGFALHLARVCDKVTGVDSSRPSLEVADQNASLNNHDIEWIEANAFDLLKDYSAASRRYDIIVIDPPAFAKTRRNLESALRGYKELNLRALKMLRAGGILVSCSCSYHVTDQDFIQMLANSSSDIHRPLRILERRGQAKDHPVLATVPETSYLKCVIASVSS